MLLQEPSVAARVLFGGIALQAEQKSDWLTLRELVLLTHENSLEATGMSSKECKGYETQGRSKEQLPA